HRSELELGSAQLAPVLPRQPNKHNTTSTQTTSHTVSPRPQRRLKRAICGYFSAVLQPHLQAVLVAEEDGAGAEAGRVERALGLGAQAAHSALQLHCLRTHR